MTSASWSPHHDDRTRLRSVNGTVETRDGQPVPDCWIEAVPSPAAEIGILSDHDGRWHHSLARGVAHDLFAHLRPDERSGGVHVPAGVQNLDDVRIVIGRFSDTD